MRYVFVTRRAPARLQISTAFGNQHFANTPYVYNYINYCMTTIINNVNLYLIQSISDSQVASLASWLLEDRTLSQGLLPQTGTAASTAPRRRLRGDRAVVGREVGKTWRLAMEKHGTSWQKLRNSWENHGQI